MRFEHPWFLLLLPLLILLWVLLTIITARRRRRKLAALLGSRADDPEVVRLSPAVRNWKYFCLFAAAAALTLGLARPYWNKERFSHSTAGSDVLVIFDVSRSMYAADPAPSRMEQGKYFFRELLKHDQTSRFGLIAFAGDAFQSSPFTDDRKVTGEYIDELSPEIVPRGGTDIEKALTLALQIFKRDPGGPHRAALIITDGDELQGDFKALAAQFKAAGIPIAVVGLGSPEKAVTIPDGKGGEIKSIYGETAFTRLNEKALQQLAADAGGIYVRSTAFAPGVNEVKNFLQQLPRKQRENTPKDLPRHTFIFFFAAAFIFMVAALLLNERPSLRKKSVLISAALLGAVELFAANPAELYNSGLAFQRQKNYEKAMQSYTALLAAPGAGKELQSRALHNMGVIRHQQGRKELRQIKDLIAKENLPEAEKLTARALKSLQSSREHYSQSLYAAANPAVTRLTAANLRQLAVNVAAVKKLQAQIKQLQQQKEKAQQDIQKEQQQNRKDNQTQQQQQKQQQAQNKEQQKNQQNQKSDKEKQAPKGASQPSPAENSAKKLADDARKLEQKKLAENAEKARQELEKARRARDKKDFQQAQKHLDRAAKLLPPPEKGDDKNKNRDGKKGDGKEQPQNDPGAADEKKLEILNDANRNIQLHLKNSPRHLPRKPMPQVEKHW